MLFETKKIVVRDKATIPDTDSTEFKELEQKINSIEDLYNEEGEPIIVVSDDDNAVLEGLPYLIIAKRKQMNEIPVDLVSDNPTNLNETDGQPIDNSDGETDEDE